MRGTGERKVGFVSVKGRPLVLDHGEAGSGFRAQNLAGEEGEEKCQNDDYYGDKPRIIGGPEA